MLQSYPSSLLGAEHCPAVVWQCVSQVRGCTIETTNSECVFISWPNLITFTVSWYNIQAKQVVTKYKQTLSVFLYSYMLISNNLKLVIHCHPDWIIPVDKGNMKLIWGVHRNFVKSLKSNPTLTWHHHHHQSSSYLDDCWHRPLSKNIYVYVIVAS